MFLAGQLRAAAAELWRQGATLYLLKELAQVSRVPTAVLVGLFVAVNSATAQSTCASWKYTAGGTPLELAPPKGYTEICSQDAALCHTLTAGYPPSAITVGYFVPSEEWAAFRQHKANGFRHYLIAQIAGSMTARDLPALKEHIHVQQGDVTDHTELPSVFEARGRAPLGIFAETEKSISFGVVMRLHPTTGGPDAADVVLVATNSALAIGERMLSLYVYHDYTTESDIPAAEKLTRDWLSCIEAGARSVSDNAPAL